MSFITEAMLRPKNIGAVAPSSKRLAKLMTENADLKHAKVVVELGPGTGVFTELILQEIPESAAFMAIEQNEHFVTIMRAKYPTVDTIHGSAEHLKNYLKERGAESCDKILSGLPWASFDERLQRLLLSKIYESLSPDGVFLTFAYYPINHLPRGRTFKRQLRRYFKDIKKTRVVLNVPPAFVYICKR